MRTSELRCLHCSTSSDASQDDLAHARPAGYWRPADGARSEAERATLPILDSTGIPGWVANYRVGPYLVDFALPEEKTAIEIDGLAFHSDAAAFERDRRKQNYLVGLVWPGLFCVSSGPW